MKCQTAQLILWIATMAVFGDLAFRRNFDGLIIAIVISSLVWCMVVPRTTSR